MGGLLTLGDSQEDPALAPRALLRAEAPEPIDGRRIPIVPPSANAVWLPIKDHEAVSFPESRQLRGHAPGLLDRDVFVGAAVHDQDRRFEPIRPAHGRSAFDDGCAVVFEVAPD